MKALEGTHGTAVWGAGQVAVVRSYAVDQLTPMAAFMRLRPLGAHTLLESVEGDEKIARYSIIAVGEWARLLEADGQAVLVGPEGTEVGPDPVAMLRKQQARQRVEVPADVELPYVGGAVGYFSYDWVRHLERLPQNHPRRGPRWEWVWPREVVIFDHRRQRVTLIVEGDGENREAAYDRLTVLADALARPLAVPAPSVARTGAVQANMTEAEYREKVIRAQQYIRAGDIFQVVLSQRLFAPIVGDPLHLYRKLRRVNPSPYLFYMETPRRILAGSSPEALIRVTGRTVANRPIAGTRARGRDAAEDARLWEELIHDAKERAEHIMLVDLARNDLGRVSEYGSVRVTEYMRQELYSHVMHIVSEVQGRLRPGLDALDALAAAFPAGTLTGAPKIRAMEIIDELEPESRGAYGGVVGYWSHRGDLDACITIRTLEVDGDMVSVQAGGGVVADSRPEMEYQESLNKAGAALSTLEPAEEEWL